jgi:hypothetical protein
MRFKGVEIEEDKTLEFKICLYGNTGFWQNSSTNIPFFLRRLNNDKQLKAQKGLVFLYNKTLTLWDNPHWQRTVNFILKNLFNFGAGPLIKYRRSVSLSIFHTRDILQIIKIFQNIVKLWNQNKKKGKLIFHYY